MREIVGNVWFFLKSWTSKNVKKKTPFFNFLIFFNQVITIRIVKAPTGANQREITIRLVEMCQILRIWNFNEEAGGKLNHFCNFILHFFDWLNSPDSLDASYLMPLERCCWKEVPEVFLNSRKASTRRAYLAKWNIFSIWFLKKQAWLLVPSGFI